MTPKMSIRSPLIVAALLVALVGCAGSSDKRKGEGKSDEAKKPATTLERIDQDMTQAAASLRPATPQKVQDAMLPSLQVDLPKGAAEAVEPRFDLVVSRAPAAQVFMALVANTPYSMLVSPEVSGTISVSLKNVTVKEALESLRDIYGYDFTIRGTRVQVQPNSVSTRVFQVNYLVGKRTGTSDLRVASGSITSQSPTGTTVGSDSSRVSMATQSDYWTDLKAALNSLIGNDKEKSVIVNPMSGVVLVKAAPAELRAVENYLKATRAIVERQVMLEAKIIDVSLSKEFQSGVNWAFFGPNSSANGSRAMVGVAESGASLATSGALGVGGVTANLASRSLTNGSPGPVNGLALQTDNFSSLIRFLETQGQVQVLSSPRIATLNNQKALLKVGTDEYFVTEVTGGSTTNSALGNGTSAPNYTAPAIKVSPFFSGITLDVTPQIDDENNIILHVHPSVSVVKEKEKVINLGAQMGTMILPLASSTINETDSIVRVQDGNIVAIGGLMKQGQAEERSQVPGLGDVPFLGGLFGQRGSSMSKRELVILIKSTIIQGEAQWAKDVNDTQARIREFQPPPPPPKKDETESTGKPPAQ